MYYDDLPLWGFIGKVEKILRPGQPAEMRYYLFTHVHFDISYNNDRVIEINVSTDPLRTVDITEGDSIPVEFSYSVKWKETSIPFDRRMEKYSRYSFLPQHLEIHWFSIINSCVTVLLLTGTLLPPVVPCTCVRSVQPLRTAWMPSARRELKALRRSASPMLQGSWPPS
jgi:hypothetical protein